MTEPVQLPGPLSYAEAYSLIYSVTSKADILALQTSPDGRAMLDVIVNDMVDRSARLERTITARHLLARPSDATPVATGQVRATCQVAISRAKASVGVGITIPLGTRVQTSDGHIFTLDADVVFAPGLVGPVTANVTALFPGFSSNVIAPSINSFALVGDSSTGDLATLSVSGGVNTLARYGGDYFVPKFIFAYLTFTAGSNTGKTARITSLLTGDPATQVTLTCDSTLVAESGTATWLMLEWAALGFTVVQTTDAVDGRDDELDSIGRESGQSRQSAETDADYIRRLTRIRDVVTPRAIIQAINRILGGYGPATVYELGCGQGNEDSSLGLSAWPGFVVGAFPLGVDPTSLDTPGALVPDAPPKGLSVMGGMGPAFLVKWSPIGVDDPGMYVDNTALPFSDLPPMSFGPGLGPVNSTSFPDNSLYASIAEELNRLKAWGVSWNFLPPFGT